MWAGAEYHLGLALGMNVGLDSYVDTRFAVNLFRSLPPSRQATWGSHLLTNALQANPFNPEAWYLLAGLTPDAVRGLELAKTVRGHDPGGELEVVAHPSLENFVEAEHPKPVETAMLQYWRTVEEYVTRYAVLRHSVPEDAATARTIYEFLKAVPGMTPEDLSPYAARSGEPPIEGPASKKGSKRGH